MNQNTIHFVTKKVRTQHPRRASNPNSGNTTAALASENNIKITAMTQEKAWPRRVSTMETPQKITNMSKKLSGSIAVSVLAFGLSLNFSGMAQKKAINFLDCFTGIRSGCGKSPQRHTFGTIHRSPLGLCSLSPPVARRSCDVFAERVQALLRTQPANWGKSLVTSRKVTDMKNTRSCADGAYGAPTWRRIQKPQRKAYRIELTQTDCALLDKIRKPGQTHVEAFRELLRRVG